MSNTERPTRPEPEVCGRCEGSGAMYADGGAHDMSENAPTIRCGVCGGEGTVRDEEALEAYIDTIERRITELEAEHERLRDEIAGRGMDVERLRAVVEQRPCDGDRQLTGGNNDL